MSACSLMRNIGQVGPDCCIIIQTSSYNLHAENLEYDTLVSYKQDVLVRYHSCKWSEVEGQSKTYWGHLTLIYHTNTHTVVVIVDIVIGEVKVDKCTDKQIDTPKSTPMELNSCIWTSNILYWSCQVVDCFKQFMELTFVDRLQWNVAYVKNARCRWSHHFSCAYAYSLPRYIPLDKRVGCHGYGIALNDSFCVVLGMKIFRVRKFCRSYVVHFVFCCMTDLGQV